MRWKFAPVMFTRRPLGATPRSGPTSARLETTLLLAHALTPRERDVARLLLRGDTNADVARTLAMGVYTAKDHVKRVFAKTKTSSRAELAARLGRASTGQ